MGAEKYPHIFSPGRIGPLQTKNRIKYAATETNFNTRDGYVTDKEIAYLEAQARGGSGIVTTQGAFPDAKGEGKGFMGTMAIYDDRFIPGLARLAEGIKSRGALACLQILHCGREGGVELDYCLMPSVVPQKLSYFKPPREITLNEIKQSVRDHVDAARRAVEAGYDMIEISGIVGYLISTFISRYSNKRQDGYGGDLRERCRLMIEVLQGIKAQVGSAVPVGIRLCGAELLDDRGGNTLEESIESFRIAEEAGADFLSVTVGWHESSQSVITRDVPMGQWLWVAKEVKKAVSVPVMMAFRLFTPGIPERALAEGTIDYWEACRPMIADPELAKKVAEGREDEIIPCIACNLCFSRLYYHQPIMCSVRPTLGHEGEEAWGYYGFPSVAKKKKIIVVGAGPSGLQCAAVAAARGHDVSLYEQREMSGGNMLLASKIDEGDSELLRPISSLEARCRKVGVTFHFNTQWTAQISHEERADVTVIATGAELEAFPFECSHDIVAPQEVILGGRRPGRRVVILGGDGAGLGTALFLVRQGGYDVSVIEESSKLGRDVNPFYLWRYVRQLKGAKVLLLPNSRPVSVHGDRLKVATGKGEMEIQVDTLIMARRRPFQALEELRGRLGAEVYFIGDAKRPRRLNNALHDGYRLGMEI
jgi:2,4-dienoyl-CoA reductase (NADPH2)